MKKNNRGFNKKTEFNRNSYVTASLFVVFALLTGVYLALPGEDDQTVLNPDPLSGIQTTVTETDGEATTDETTTGETTEETSSVKESSLESLRLAVEVAKSKKVAELEAVMGAADTDDATKDEAKTELETINSNSEHAEMLEATIKSKGYEDVLVRVNEDQVQLVVEIENAEAVPATEEINELYILAKTEFGNDPYVTIEFEPVN